MLNFPSTPTTGQIFTAPNGVAWVWDATKWTSGATGSGFLPLTGGTLTGRLTLNADPVGVLDAATKEYVDTPVTSLWSNIRYRNRIINGDMSVDQRNGGVTVAMGATAFAMDRWRFLNVSGLASKGAYGQITISPLVAGLPFTKCMGFQTSTAYPSAAAGDLVNFYHVVEGVNFADTQWGTANAQPVTIEFWAACGVAGTYGVALHNGAGNRSYVTTVALTTAWAKYRLTIPGDTAGIWAVADNAAALQLGFQLCAGSTYSTSNLNAWQAGNFWGATGAVNVLATTSSALYITGVALMVGAAVAIEPEFRKYSDNLIDCRRYFQIGQLYNYLGGVPWAAGVTAACSSLVPVIMRAPPTCIITINNCVNIASPSVFSDGVNFFYLSGVAPATGGVDLNANFTADSDF
jgi:hypothetical protein